MNDVVLFFQHNNDYKRNSKNSKKEPKYVKEANVKKKMKLTDKIFELSFNWNRSSLYSWKSGRRRSST